MSEASKKEQMRAIRDEIIALKNSPLYAYRQEAGNLPVIGQGSHNAEIMFIGEAPGKNEALTGTPFCGASGKILDKLLATVDINREDVYVTNIVKDRPPENRDPSVEEIAIYGPFLDRQIEIIQPKVLATLGRYAMQYIMKRFDLEFEIEPISQAHGKKWTAKTSYGTVDILPLYHPAVAVYNANQFDTLAQDFSQLKTYL